MKYEDDSDKMKTKSWLNFALQVPQKEIIISDTIDISSEI